MEIVMTEVAKSLRCRGDSEPRRYWPDSTKLGHPPFTASLPFRPSSCKSVKRAMAWFCPFHVPTNRHERIHFRFVWTAAIYCRFRFVFDLLTRRQHESSPGRDDHLKQTWDE